MSHSGAIRTTADVESLICASAANSAQAYFPSQLTALVVTGSTARGESSIREKSGEIFVLGDLELVVITPDGSAIEGLKEAVAKELSSQRIACDVSIMFCSKEQLLQLPPSVFTFELRECGKVLIGDIATLSAMPRVEPSALPLEDAWRMLGNRAVELLETLTSSGSGGANDQIGYRVAKLYLDVCTSLLIFAGGYEPSYAARTVKLCANLASLSSRVQADLSNFAVRTRRALEAKLSGNAVEEFSSPESIGMAIQFLLLINRWELQQMAGSATTLDAYISSRDLQARVRGWAAVTRRVDPKDAAINAYRWSLLVRRGSPRHLIYKVAFELLNNRASQSTDGLHDLNQLLPLPASGQRSWNSVAQATAANYHRFVEVTRS